MRGYIDEELDDFMEGKGQLDEFDFSSAFSKLKDKLTSKNDKVNRELAKVLSKQFEGNFGEFLKKYLIKQGKKMDTVQMLVNYFKSPSGDSYSDIFHLLGAPMLKYFVKKTFGKDSLRGEIKQMTPFLKKVSTGDRKLDKYVFLAMSEVLDEKEVENDFKGKVRNMLDDKLRDALDDKDFVDFLGDLMGKGEDVEEDLEEGVGDSVKKVKRGVRNVFSSTENRYRWKVVDFLTDALPKLKKNILRKVKSGVWDLKYNQVLKILRGRGNKILATVLTKAILEHIITKSKKLYFKEDYLAELTSFVEGVFTDEAMVVEMRDSIRDYLRDSHIENNKSLDKQLKKNKNPKGRYKKAKGNLVKGAIKGFNKSLETPMFKDMYKY